MKKGKIGAVSRIMTSLRESAFIALMVIEGGRKPRIEQPLRHNPSSPER